MKIGVFDSGVGGKSVANSISKAFPEHEIIYVEDREHVPYGTKSPNQVHTLVLPILLDLIEQGCEVIVVACNSVTTTIITQLRQELPVPLVGIEPMIKPAAALTKTGVIAVCATPLTLGSGRYEWLKETFAQGVKVLEPDCSDWAYMIEHNKIEHAHIEAIVEACIAQSADVIVMACTHYHWIEKDVEKLADGRAIVLQPEAAINRQLGRVIAQLA